MTTIVDDARARSLALEVLRNILPAALDRSDEQWPDIEIDLSVDIQWANDRKGHRNYTDVTASDHANDDARVSVHITAVQSNADADFGQAHDKELPALVHTNLGDPAVDIRIEFRKDSEIGQRLLGHARNAFAIEQSAEVARLNEQIAALKAQRNSLLAD